MTTPTHDPTAPEGSGAPAPGSEPRNMAPEVPAPAARLDVASGPESSRPAGVTPVPEGLDVAQGDRSVLAAAAQLRNRPLPRAVEVADRVIARALRAPRRATLVRARAPYTYLRVSSLAITTTLRSQVDAGLVGAAVGRIGMEVTRDEVLRELTVELLVQYRTDISAVAELTRALAQDALDRLLGPVDPLWPDGEVAVTVSHVHVSDVTVADPHLADPADEQ